MYIETEQTPNPLTLKFLPDRAVTDNPQELRGEDAPSPLARAILRLNGIESVFFGLNFISVTKDSADRDWRHLKAPVIGAIMDHFVEGRSLYDGGPVIANTSTYDEATQSIVDEIISVIDERVRPAVAQDGGDIVFDRFVPEDGTVYLHMRGACAGCPSSTITLKNGIETMLKRYIPEVTRVESSL
jgi:Fe-S cluster biogenesis protein NfuA